MMQKNTFDRDVQADHESEKSFQPPKHDFKRIENLSKFQFTLLNHALNLPKMKKVCYSTCSIYQLENENVVQSALKKNPDWTLFNCHTVESIGDWGGLGVSGDEFVDKNVLRLDGRIHQTQGFFVACFVRKEQT